MRGFLSTIAVIGLVALGEAGLAQQRPLPSPPDLSGTWATAPAETTERLIYSPFGARFTIKQDSSTITITTDQSITRAADSITYRLDDSEQSRTRQTASGSTWTLFTRARFVTAALVVTARIDAGPTGHWEDLFIISLDKPGQVSVVACNASSSGGMSTVLFKYTKVQ